MPTFFQKLFPRPATTNDHAEVITRTTKMVHAKEPKKLARRHGLDMVDLTWEDTGRYKGSSVGPNISDMTIQVQRSTDSDAR